MESWLQMKDVSFAHSEEPLFSNLSLELLKGEVCHLQAKDCRGVSTLTRLMVALAEPQTGTVKIFDQDVKEVTKEEFLKSRLKLSYVFDTGGLLSNRTLLENVMLPLIYHQMMAFDEAKALSLTILNDLGLSTEVKNRPALVNASARKLTLIARALVVDPEAIVLDDPDNGLNKHQVENVINLLVDYMAHHRLHSLVIASRLTSLWDRILTHSLTLQPTALKKEAWVQPKKAVA